MFADYRMTHEMKTYTEYIDGVRVTKCILEEIKRYPIVIGVTDAKEDVVRTCTTL